VSAPAAPTAPVLSVRNLQTHFRTFRGVARAVDDVSFDVYPGETLGVVGESGCGKSVTSLSIMRLVDPPAGFHPGGQILFGGRDLLTLPEREMRTLRGGEVAIIFQEPMTSLNPVYTVGEQIAESVRLHEGLSKPRGDEARGRDAQAAVGIPTPVPARRRLPAPALRRHAPARDDRHGAGLQPQAAHRRRAHHRARRHHPGADPRPDAAS
jgi:ABC-type dipeptide/oligopeptide/nickel transport system ATPase component